MRLGPAAALPVFYARVTVESLVKLAHSHCFIANSVKSDIRIEPEIVILKL